MSGLLHRGLIYLNNARASGDTAVNGAHLSGTEGISKEDQQDIIKQIEQVAAENRILATPEVFAYQALKRGSLFPLAVNIIAIIALAGGLALMSYFFRQTQSRITGQDVKITTAEGQILQEVKREAQQQILQKNNEIKSIQDRLVQIDAERTSLQKNMDSRIQQREAELKRQMEAALATERKQLQNQGVSQTEITRRINALQAANNAKIASQMEEFRKQAEVNRQKTADSLKKLADEYQSNLTQATQQKEKIQQEADQKISKLQTQLRGQVAQSQRQLSAAEQRLQAMQDANQKAEMASSQITGFYTQIRSDVDQRKYEPALKVLSNLKEYLSTNSVLQIPSIRERLPSELFIVNSLTSLVNQQLSQSTQTTKNVLAAASIIDQANSLAAQAAQLVKQGSNARARNLYGRALALIPGIEASHQYFMDQDAIQVDSLQKQLSDLEAQQTKLKAETGNVQKQLTAETDKNRALIRARQADLAQRQASQARLKTAFDQARRLYEQGKYQQSLDQYKVAMSYLPVGNTANTMVDQIAGSRYRLSTDATVKAATEKAAPLLLKGQELVSNGKFSDAIDAYAELIGRYPMAKQVPIAAADMKSAFTQEVANLQNQVTSLTGENKKLTGRVSTLTEQMATLQSKLSEAVAQLDAAQRTSAPSRPTIDAATAKELDQLRKVNATYEALKAAYNKYASAQNTLLGPAPTTSTASLPSQAKLLEGKVMLDQFLSSNNVETLFNGLLDRIRQYDRGFEASGRSTALSDMSDIVYNLSQYTTQKDRSTYLAEQMTLTTNTETKGFLQDLSQLIGGK